MKGTKMHYFSIFFKKSKSVRYFSGSFITNKNGWEIFKKTLKF